MARVRSPWLLALLGIVILLVVWLWGGYNSLVASREGVEGAWSQVETQYQRRFDLVPNLVETVKGAANFEQETLTAVTQARTQWQGAQGNRPAQIAAAEGFESALARLIVTVESYPQLKATEAFRDLMAQLEGTENRIATARKDYNEAVQQFNVKVKRFPGNILAGLFGFGAETFFQSTEGSENAPTVDFE
ncbi:MAG: LemA family protein [Candidatus Peregrinibacteria bacterium]|nr:LemA family protein [Candidatus Peregrinibacteria bacterium]